MNDKNTTVYYSDYCSHCKKLKKWLTKQNILFKELDVNDPEVSKELDERGVKGIPYTVIEYIDTHKTQEIIGFNKEKFEIIFLP